VKGKDPQPVLHVVGTLDPGGVEIWLLSLFAETQGRGVTHAVTTLGPSAGSLEDAASRLGVGVRRCPLPPLPSFPRRFSHLLRSGQFEAVHSHVHLASGWLLWLARRSGLPVRVAHSHTTRDDHRSTPARRVYRRLSRLLIRRHATAGVAASSDCAKALFGSGWTVDPRFRVIHNGVDLSRFSGDVDRREVRSSLGFTPDAVVVGQVGRFHRVKNHVFSVRVAAELARRDPRVRFLFVGEGPLRGATERQAADLGIGARCVFVGGAGVDVPRLLIGAMDLVICPSLWEGLPVSLVEAQAAALPVLASSEVTREVAAVPDLVRFVDLGEGPAAWAASVEEMLRIPRISPQAAQEYLAQTDFDIRRSARRLLEVYAFP
jgi:glycosyltransferase involved in cell wall biosynthesis